MKHRDASLSFPLQPFRLREAIKVYDKVIRINSRLFNYYTLSASNLTENSHYSIYDARKEHFHHTTIGEKETREEAKITLFHRRPTVVIPDKEDFIVEYLQLAKKSSFSGDFSKHNRYIDFFNGKMEVRAASRKEIEHIYAEIEKILR